MRNFHSFVQIPPEFVLMIWYIIARLNTNVIVQRQTNTFNNDDLAARIGTAKASKG